MTEFIRTIKPLESKSFFLFGARGVGKSTFIRNFLRDKSSLFVDLLSPAAEDKYAKNPDLLAREIIPHHASLEWIVIDEVQKCPKLLDVVQMLIVEHQLKFILSGSSARRLKQKGVNLLAGRALNEYMFPLTHIELASAFDLQAVLETGSLPEVRTSESVEVQHAFLRAYALNYITTEIQAEQWVKNLPPFRRFLEVAGQMNGKILNYTSIAKDIGVDPNTVQSYFEILEDTLIGIRLPGFSRSLRKQQRQAPKFFLFDLGVKRALDRTLDVPLKPQTAAYGEAFEHFVIVEIMRQASYARKDFRYSYLLTKDGVEIDLIVDRPGRPTVLVEIKSKNQVDSHDGRHLKHFETDFKDPLRIIISNDETEKNFDGIKSQHWRKGIKEIIDS
jgi:predicted AAA+ superfamily ATPase